MSGEKPHILVVEDEFPVRECIRMIFKNLADLTIVNDYTAGITELEDQASRYNGVITDLRWANGISGLDVLKAAERTYDGLPVFVLTGHGNFDLVAAVEKKASEVGYVELMIKPPEVSELQRRVMEKANGYIPIRKQNP